MQDLEGSLMARAWPEDKVVIGLRVNRWVRAQLVTYAESVVLGRIGWGGKAAVPTIDVTSDMGRFQDARVRFQLFMHACPVLCPPLLNSLKVAWRSALGSKIVRLEIVDSMEWSTRTGEVLEQIPLLCTSLTHLRINGLQAQPDSFVRFCSNLPRCAELADLNLQSCCLYEGQTISLARSLATSTALTSLNIANNAITSFFDVNFHLQQCSSLQSLDFSGNSNLHISDLGSLLSTLSDLKKLVLRSLKLHDSDGARLVSALEPCKDLECLDVASNRLGDVGLSSLVNGLRQHVRLEYLDLTENEMTREKACDLFSVVRSFHSIVFAFFGSFPLSEHNLDCYAVKCLGDRNTKPKGPRDASVWQNSMAVLHFQHNIGCNEMMKLAVTLPRHSLLHLDLAGNMMKDSGARMLGSSLVHCPNLLCLVLDRNRIEKVGMEGLAAGLATSGSLRTLSVGHNGMKAAGVRALVPVLTQCKLLRVINLRANELGPDGADVLARSSIDQVSSRLPRASRSRLPGADVGGWWCQCKELESIDLRENALGDMGVVHLSLTIAHCRALQRLDLAKNGVGVQGMQRLADMLPLIPKLRRLVLSGNQIGDAGAVALCGVAANCAALNLLDVAGNGIGQQAQTQLASAFPNPSLEVRFECC